ncbi:MAG: DUF350 domain-containing protein [Gemmatimonadetes bacterium]|nr:DUF350 domain-containing protein [Gemmatimonadota bacterium]|tara:strand:- start:7884 stop:8729 length:846 start_codon:yes stop_codon:yes gene_type:complete
MIWNNLIESGIYLVCVYVLFWLGKLVYDLTTPSYKLKEELVEKDNTALAVAVVGYYFGLILAIGGVIVGPSQGLEADLIDVLIYGPLAIILMNLSRLINDKLILHGFSIREEIIRDHNVGTGVVVSASYIATGLIIFGAVSGVMGDLVTSIVFWILGQVALVLAGLFYNWITPYDIHAQIEKENVAAGVAFAGGLVGIGNIVRHAVAGDFISWSMELQTFGLYILVGLVVLPIVRVATDKILLPGQKLSNEIANQEKPNLGAGFIEAFSYVGASFLLVWIL